MRLIDVDNFKKNNPEYLKLDIDYVTEVTVEDVLDCEPTVKAIPIEWIKKQIEEEKYRMLMIDHIEWHSCLSWLIDEWKKENETQFVFHYGENKVIPVEWLYKWEDKHQDSFLHNIPQVVEEWEKENDLVV